MNKNNPKISIIVPMYNCAEYAPKCIENIINQDYQNWELLLTHGDSKDGTEAVCQAYEDKDPRIKNFYHIDGLVPARNVGYDNATGDWIMYIDGDDWIDTNCLGELVQYIQEYDDLDVIFWNYIQEYNGKLIEGKTNWECDELTKLYTGNECQYLAAKVLDYKSGINEAYCKLVRRDYALKFNLYHNKNLRQGIEGGEYGLRVMHYAKKALFVNKEYYKYRYNPTSLSKVISYNNVKWIHESLDEIYKFIMSNEVADKKQYLYYFYQRALYALCAVCMSTYFHPNNSSSFFEKVAKFKDDMKKFYAFPLSLRHGDYSSFDNKRKFTLYLVKYHLYYFIPLVSYAKMMLMRIGKFNY